MRRKRPREHGVGVVSARARRKRAFRAARAFGKENPTRTRTKENLVSERGFRGDVGCDATRKPRSRVAGASSHVRRARAFANASYHLRLLARLVLAQLLNLLAHLVQGGGVVDVVLAVGDELLARPAGEIRGVRGDRAGILQQRARVRARGGERDARAEKEHALGGHVRTCLCSREVPVPRIREETQS